jgi:adenylate kinase
MTKSPRIVILGPQGSGKGTQAGRLKHRLHIPHVSTGDVLRDEVALGSALGKKIAAIINVGNMLPDTLTNAFMRKRIAERDCRAGWIIDGYPRSFAQAKPFQRFGRPNVVIYLHFLDRQAIQRLSGRRVCAKGHVYHLRHDPPKKKSGYCDHDGLPLKQRDDDTPAAIRKRLHIYHTRTEPVIDWYRRRRLVVEVDASRPIPVVYRQVLKKLRDLPWLSSRLRTK